MNRIRELRKDGGYKQIDFCKMLGISQATLSGYETGRYQPDNEMLLKIASMFDVSIDYILGNSDIKKAPSLEDAGLSAEEAVIENADFVRYIVIFRGLYSSFSYTFPTSIKTLYNIFPVISFTMYLSP